MRPSSTYIYAVLHITTTADDPDLTADDSYREANNSTVLPYVYIPAVPLANPVAARQPSGLIFSKGEQRTEPDVMTFPHK